MREAGQGRTGAPGMVYNAPMHEVTLALLLLALTCAASLARPLLRLAVPLPLVQILFGTVAALCGLQVQFDPHAFLLLFIPPLLFADGWRMPRRALRALRWPLLGNAVGLVFVTVLVGGALLHWLIPDLPLSVAFAIAAVVSPTDPVAIGSITEGVIMPRRLMHVLESEALLNDASGLVALRFAVAATLTGVFSWQQAALQFVMIAAGGLAIGWGVTWLYAQVSRRAAPREEDATLNALLPLLLPFAAYWLAEHAGVSGVLAAVAAGIAANREGLMERAAYATRLHSSSMWQLIGYSFNGIIFVLLGSQLPAIVGPTPGGLDLATERAPLLVAGYIGALILLLIVLRLGWTLLSLWIERLTGRSDPFPGWRLVLVASLAGVRGAITLAGVLTIPLSLPSGAPFPSRDLAITLAVGVILGSLLIAAISLPLLLRHLPPAEDPLDDELRIARIAAARAAIAAIEAQSGEQTGAGDVERDSALDAYRRRLERLSAPVAAKARVGAADTWRDLHATALQAERVAVRDLRVRNVIDDEVARRVLGELDVLEAASMQVPLRLRPAPVTPDKTGT
jgi:Na+/H+ antiporter